MVSYTSYLNCTGGILEKSPSLPRPGPMEHTWLARGSEVVAGRVTRRLDSRPGLMKILNGRPRWVYVKGWRPVYV